MRVIVEVNVKENFSLINEKVKKIILRILLIDKVKQYFQNIHQIDFDYLNELKKNSFEKSENEIKEYYEKKYKLAKLIIDCITVLSSECFNIIAQKIIKYKLENILQNQDLPVKYRRSFFYFFSLYYYGHQQIIKEKLNFSELLSRVPQKNIEIESCLFNNKYIIKIDSSEIGEKNKINLEQNEENSLNNSIIKKRLDHEEDIFEILVNQLRRFPSDIKLMKVTKIKGNPNCVLKYFIKVILIPTLSAIFKILYMNDSINLKNKLLLISIVTHFFQCYDLLLKIIKTNYSQRESALKKVHEFLHFNFESPINTGKYLQKINFTLERLMKYTLNFELKGIYNMDLQICLAELADMKKDFTFDCNIWRANYNFLSVKDSDFEKNFVDAFNDYKSIKSQISDKSFLIGKIFDSKEQIYENTRENIFHYILELIRENITKKIVFNYRKKDNKNNKYKNTKFLHENYDKQILNFPMLIPLINNILNFDPSMFQLTIINNLYNHSIFHELFLNSIPIFFQSVINDFKSFNFFKFDRYKYDGLIDSIEFLRLLCENHNKYFQTFICNYQLEYNSKKFISFLKIDSKDKVEDALPDIKEKNYFVSMMFTFYSYVIDLINHSSTKINYKNFLCVQYEDGGGDIEKLEFFNSILNKFTDLFIELCQGTVTYNFNSSLSFEKNHSFQIYFITSHKIIANFQNELRFEHKKILSNFLKFIITFLNEDKNPLENKKSILKEFDTTKLLYLLVSIMKTFYCNVILKDPLQNFIHRDGYKKLYKYYKYEMKVDHYEKELLNNDNNKDDNDILLNISIQIFLLVKLASSYDTKFLHLLQNLESSSKNNQSSKREIFLFFQKIVNNVEIWLKEIEHNPEETDIYFRYLFLGDEEILQHIIKDSIENKDVVKKIIFVSHPISLMLTNKDLIGFMNKAPLEQKNHKLYFLIKSIPELEDTLNIRMYFHKYHPLFYKIQKIQFIYKGIISVLLVILINILSLLSLKLTPNNDGKLNFDLLINLISVINMIYSSFIIVISFWYKATNLSKFTHKRLLKQGDDFSKEKIIDYLNIFREQEITLFLWNLIFGILGFLNDNLRFFYSIQLFTVFNLSQTMRIVIKTLEIKYTQFLATFVLIMIISLFYANLSFLYYRDFFWSEDLQVKFY